MKLMSGTSGLMLKNTVVGLLVLLCGSREAAAQKDARQYKETAEKFRQQIWSGQAPEFKVRSVPAEYADYSAIVMARSIEIIGDSKKRSKLFFGSFQGYRELTFTQTVRELIKINDKSALAEYSEIEYTRLQKRSGLYVERRSTMYVGIRVIKPDGSVKEVPVDDVVLTKDESRVKEAKIAVADLQVGDLVDYYIVKQDLTDNVEPNDELFTRIFRFYDDLPVLNNAIHIELGKKYAIEYRCYNGAPDFKVTKSEDDDNIFDLVKKNSAPVKGADLWVSPYRQLPIIRFNILLGYKGIFSGIYNTRKPGMVYKNQLLEEFVQDEINSVANQNYLIKEVGFYEVPELHRRILDMKRSKVNPDSIAAEIYYTFRYSSFLRIISGMNPAGVVNRGQLELDINKITIYLSHLCHEFKTDASIVLGTSRYGPDPKEILGNDFRYLLYIPEGKRKFIGMADIYSPGFYLPAELEGNTTAVALNVGFAKRAGAIEKSTTSIPVSNASANLRVESLVVDPLLSTSDLQISRNTKLSGHYSNDLQGQLILMEDYINAERKAFGIAGTVLDEMRGVKKGEKYAEELAAAFAEERKKQPEKFKAEIADWFEQEISELKDTKVINLGVRHTRPVFEFASVFKMNGCVKKAGNNYIVEIGKLQGTPLKITEEQRKRTIDVYMPFARAIETYITLNIPEGYSCEGVAALNKAVENETGYFKTEAKVEGNKLTLSIRKSYNHALEPAANWEKLLAFIDAANDFENAKILLKKK